jgi:hypothetical protein
MRNVWIALAVIVAGSLLGAFLLWRALDTSSPARPLVGPRGAQLVQERPLGTRRIVIWRIGGHAEEPASGLYGVTIWQGKHRLYEQRAAPGTTGIRIETGDFSRDGRRDILIADESANCGFYRALLVEPTGVRQVLSRRLCGSNSFVQIRRDGLVIRRGTRAVAVWTIGR